MRKGSWGGGGREGKNTGREGNAFPAAGDRQVTTVLSKFSRQQQHVS